MIVELIARHSRDLPQRKALISGGESLSYRELIDEVAAFSGALRDRGLTSGDVVAVCLEPSFELMISLLSVMALEGIYFCLDQRYPQDRKTMLLERSGARFLLKRKAGRGVPRECIFENIDISGLALVPRSPAAESGAAVSIERSGPSGRPCNIYFTSGSTGTPKAVLGTLGSITNRFDWFNGIAPFRKGDIAYLRASTNVVMSGWEMFSPLMAGVTLYLPRSEDMSNPARLLEHVSTRRITHLSLVPTLAQLLLQHERTDLESLAGLRVLEIGGEHSAPGLLRAYREILQDTVIIHRYGSTEYPAVICQPLLPGREVGDAVSVGKPIDNVCAVVLDEEREEVAPGQTGILYVGGSGLSVGYLNDPEMTAQRFITHPLAGRAGDRLYCTGDLARVSSAGDLEILGRNDFTIKMFGHRIEPREVELAILDHPGIKDAVVVKSDHLPDQLVGFVVQAGRANADTVTLLRDSALKKLLLERLPAHMVPEVFISLPGMPLLASGKVDRIALRAMNASAVTAPPEVPKDSELIEALQRIWCSTFGVEQAGPDSDFFELDGSSLAAVRLVSRLRSSLGLNISMRLLFDFPRFDEFSREVCALNRQVAQV